MAFKRVATEGHTTDGREIPRDWLQQMADNYDPQTYGARISLEHIRGVLPDSPFKMYGDVRALRVAENDAGKLELFADIDPTDELKAMVKARQKVFTSIEVEPNFAQTNSAYLTGLAVTDNPASLGNEMLQFSGQSGDKSPLASRKHTQSALFTAAVEIDDPEKPDREFADAPKGDGKTLGDRIRAMFARQDKAAAQGDDNLREEVAEGMQLFAERHQSLADQVSKLPTSEQITAMQSKVDEMYAALNGAPDQPPRAPSTGGRQPEELADC